MSKKQEIEISHDITVKILKYDTEEEFREKLENGSYYFDSKANNVRKKIGNTIVGKVILNNKNTKKKL